MENKTILLTGANGGLGKAFVNELIKQKPKKLYCAIRDLSKKEELESLDSCIEVVELDISKKESIIHLVSKIDNLDILINNAGISKNRRLFDENFSEIEVNLKGTINLTRELYLKLQHKDAIVVNITSILALVNLPLMADYCISKSALHSFTQALRAEMSAFEAKVFEVLPGPIDTRLTEGSPLPKAKPEDIAKAVLEDIENNLYEIYPDDFSKMIKERLDKEPTKVVEEFSMSISS